MEMVPWLASGGWGRGLWGRQQALPASEVAHTVPGMEEVAVKGHHFQLQRAWHTQMRFSASGMDL